MELIDTGELKQKLDRGEDFKLVMVLGEWEYRAMHIPGSLRVSTAEEGAKTLDPTTR
jgi:rhodanese-related sulfurtransferase